jgi:signal transduction histidine kinase
MQVPSDQSRGSHRYDDSVLTLLARADMASTATAPAVFQNLVDLLIQDRPSTRGDARSDIFEALERLRPDVPDRVVARMATRLGTATRPPEDAVVWFMADSPAVRAALLRHVWLSDDVWALLMPRLGDADRRLLLERTDLPERARQLLAASGVVRLGLPPSSAIDRPVPVGALQAQGIEPVEPVIVVADAPETIEIAAAPIDDTPKPEPLAVPVTGESEFERSQTQIRDLLRRIAEFKATRLGDRPPPEPDISLPITPLAPRQTFDAAPEQDDLDAGGRVESIAPEPAMVWSSLDDAAEPAVTESVEPVSEDARPDTPAEGDVAGDAAPTPTVQPDVRALADLAWVGSDWHWETDREGRLVALQTYDQSGASAPAPSAQGDWLLGLVTEPESATGVGDALRRRRPFRDKPVQWALPGGEATDWLMSGVPVFEIRSGRFCGFRGTVRRPFAGRQPAAETPAAVPPTAEPANADVVRTVAHELRTPLTAIVGFAQMIDVQAWGAVDAGYRATAQSILQQSERVLRAIDDVVEVDRQARGLAGDAPELVNACDVVSAVVEALQADAKSTGVYLIGRYGAGSAPVWSTPERLTRTVARLVWLGVSHARSGETLLVNVRLLPDDRVQIAVRLSDEGLAGSAHAETLSFSTALLRQMAGGHGGAFSIQHGQALLDLPSLPPEPSLLAATRL